ncbi:MAG: GMC family oxidoreductase N-terminal domain-containing protein [Steroidobacteraceae bacterium]
MNTFDYIIVGAGAAGCVMAHRLSADSSAHVLLIEAGGPGNHPLIHMPKGIAKVMASPDFTWPYMTEAEDASNNIGESWARGRVLGGSSAVNGMVYVRGQPADYDALATQTSPDWNWQQIGAAFKVLEHHELGAAPTRGDRGPLHISLPPARSEIVRAAIAAGAAMGLTQQSDVNDPQAGERIGYVPLTVHKGRRQSAAVAFLDPIRGRRNLTIVTNVAIDKVLFDGPRAAGVVGSRAGGVITYHARREVILSAGALSTPAILQRSGVGPANHLRALNIPVVHDSPELGRNLREHRGLVMQWRVRDDVSHNREFRGARLVANTLRYGLLHDGPMSSGAYEAGAWFKSQPDLAQADAQILIAPHTFDYSSPTFAVEPHGGMNCCVYVLRPESTGALLIRSTNPAELPLINSNYNSAESDRRKMIRIVRYARELVAQAPLAQLVMAETRPGPSFGTDEEILVAHRQFGYGSYHASGTCRMGKDDAAPVDPQLRVRGTEGLRVIDTSVFPFLLSGNTNAPATAIAWRAADVILQTQASAVRSREQLSA